MNDTNEITTLKKSILGVKSVSEISGVEFVSAEKILGPSFAGKNIVNTIDFTTPTGEKLHVRMLQPADAEALFHFYYSTLSDTSRGLFASRPIFHPGYQNAAEMKTRLERLGVGCYPSVEQLEEINSGNAADIFNPKFPVVKEVKQLVDGKEMIVQKQVLFDPSLNYVIETAQKEIVGFFQIKYLASRPIFGIAVSDARHNHGLGRFGIRMAVDAARRLGLKKVSLTHDPHNVAGKLYEQEGFTPVGKSIVLQGTPQEHEEIAMDLILS